MFTSGQLLPPTIETKPRSQGAFPFPGSGFWVLTRFPLGSPELAVAAAAVGPCCAAVACSSYEAPVAGRRCPAGAVAAAAAAGCERVSSGVSWASHGRQQLPGARPAAAAALLPRRLRLLLLLWDPAGEDVSGSPGWGSRRPPPPCPSPQPVVGVAVFTALLGGFPRALPPFQHPNTFAAPLGLPRFPKRESRSLESRDLVLVLPLIRFPALLVLRAWGSPAGTCSHSHPTPPPAGFRGLCGSSVGLPDACTRPTLSPSVLPLWPKPLVLPGVPRRTSSFSTFLPTPSRTDILVLGYGISRLGSKFVNPIGWAPRVNEPEDPCQTLAASSQGRTRSTFTVPRGPREDTEGSNTDASPFFFMRFLPRTRGKYGEGAKQETFTFALTLVFIQCVINAVFAKICEYPASVLGGAPSPSYPGLEAGNPALRSDSQDLPPPL